MFIAQMIFLLLEVHHQVMEVQLTVSVILVIIKILDLIPFKLPRSCDSGFLGKERSSFERFLLHGTNVFEGTV